MPPRASTRARQLAHRVVGLLIVPAGKIAFAASSVFLTPVLFSAADVRAAPATSSPPADVPSPAPQPGIETRQVVIVVTDASGHLFTGISVSLIPWTSGGAALALRKATGSDGEVSFAGVPLGLYRIEIRAEGYATLVVKRFAVGKEKPGEGAIRRRYRLDVRTAEPAPAASR